MRFVIKSLILIAIACTLGQYVHADSPKASPLSKEDREYLDGLFRDFLFDPAGAERVRVKVVKHGRWSNSEPEPRDGWLVKGKKGEPDRVYFTDGFSILAPPADMIKRIDFLGPIKKFFNTRQPPEEETGPWVRKTAKEILGDGESYLTLAAWLYRLGHQEYARQMLGIARALKGDVVRDALIRHLASESFDAMQNAFREVCDEESLSELRHYLSKYSKLDEDKTAVAKVIESDLNLRRKQGKFGKPASKSLPKDFGTWSEQRKLDYLTSSLNDASGTSLYGGSSFGNDPIVAGLIDMGDAAVPRLIDVIEKDRRLTRVRPSYVMGGQFSPPPIGFLDVSEPATDAVMNILQTRIFPEVAGEDQTDRSPRIRAARIRQYWKRYGNLPFGERMMKILTDETNSEYQWREAAENLAKWNARRFLSAFGTASGEPEAGSGRNPYAGRFTSPTAAAAVLAALDREWGIQQSQGPGRGVFHGWPETEQKYLECLIALGDDRIAGELNRRARSAEDPDARRKYAFAARYLGERSEWIRFARDVERGQVKLQSAATADTNYAGHSNEEEELTRIVSALVRSNSPESDRAISALVDPGHPYFKLVLKLSLDPISTFDGYESPWIRHASFIRLLTRVIRDRTATGIRHVTKSSDGTGVTGSSGRGLVIRYLSEDERKAGRYRDSADERVRDVAARRLSASIAGLSYFELLRKDSGDAHASICMTMERYGKRLRAMTWQECSRIRMGSFSDGGFIPDIQPLGRPATADDVKHGLAVFDLRGNGKLADTKLPAWLLLKSEAKKEKPAFGLVVQAETDADGKLVYGVIFRHEIRAVKAEEVERIELYKTRTND